jgi:acyl-CoA synthetase (AMP-forming)/AMP-acid ligase II
VDELVPTGDVARRDADGYYWIVGRRRVINVRRESRASWKSAAIRGENARVRRAGAALGSPRARVKLRPGAACAEKEILEFVNAGLSVSSGCEGGFVDEIAGRHRQAGAGRPDQRGEF